MKVYRCLLYFIFLFGISAISPLVIHADFVKFQQNPILSFGIGGQWDEKYAYCSYIKWLNNEAKVWYSGVGSSDKRQIGYATLSTNLAINKFPNNPILSYSFLNNNHEGNDCPSVLTEIINNTTIYKMWFSNKSGSSNTNFGLYYAESNDGISWANPSPLDMTNLNNGDSLTVPSVLHNSALQIYQMWFMGRFFENNRWAIGYAESQDGIHWENISFPVLLADSDWEGYEVGNPSTYFENSIYYMTYSGDHDIYYATSSDGKHWNKNKSQPILSHETMNPSAFDSNRILYSQITKGIDGYYLFYTGSNGNKYQIGVATSNELPPIVTPSISPTITLSPSPTMNPPTSTPIPSPTIFIGKKPIVFIPGLGASWNQADIFSCNLSQSNTWTLAPYVHVYDRLINTFTKKVGLKQNKDFYIYGFDWRQSLQTAGDKLKSYLDSIPSQKVDIVSHSLGGLVARTYIQQNPLDHKVDKLITLGSPHEGTVLAYPLWENGEVNIDNLIDKTSINAVLNICRVKISPFSLATKRQVIHAMVPSIKDILPTFDFIYKNNSLITTDLLDGENTWLKNHPFTLPFGNTDLLTIGGDGKKTSNSINVKNTSAKDLIKGNWIDGEPVKFNNVSEGDGTVLRTSSVLSLANQATFPVDHIGLVNDQGSIQKILEFLGYNKNAIAAREVIPEEGPQSSFLITTSIPSLLTLSTLDNKLIQSSDKGVLVEYGDSPKTYKLKVKPLTSDNPTLFIGQNGKSENWKEYSVKLKKNAEKQFLVTYNPLKAPVNPLSPF